MDKYIQTGNINDTICCSLESSGPYITSYYYKIFGKTTINILWEKYDGGNFDKDIESSTRLNVESYLHLLKVMVPGMIKRRKGHIVLMGSLAGLYPQMSAVYGGQKGAIHRIENIYKKPVKIVEAQLGSILKETDIVRYQDIYGRVK